LLDKKGASNFREQQALLKPVIKLLKSYQLIILGDREFHSVKLANWLDQQEVRFVLRQKKGKNMQPAGQKQQPLFSLEVAPGDSKFFQEVTMGKQGFGQFCLAVKWKRKYRGKVEAEPWYLLTNLADFSSAVAAYRKRMGIEAMFKDCKTGGYHLEGSKASVPRPHQFSFVDCHCLYFLDPERTINLNSGSKRIHKSPQKSESNGYQKQ